MNDGEIQPPVLVKLMHRAGKYLVDKAVSLPAPHGPVDPRVVDFRETFGIPFDGQHLPLAAHVQQLQDVVEDFVRRQAWAVGHVGHGSDVARQIPRTAQGLISLE